MYKANTSRELNNVNSVTQLYACSWLSNRDNWMQQNNRNKLLFQISWSVLIQVAHWLKQIKHETRHINKPLSKKISQGEKTTIATNYYLVSVSCFLLTPADTCWCHSLTWPIEAAANGRSSNSKNFVRQSAPSCAVIAFYNATQKTYRYNKVQC